MPKQLYIPLPCDSARESMLRRQLRPDSGVRAELPDADIAKIVARTAGYSGSDMRNLIQEACQVRISARHSAQGSLMTPEAHSNSIGARVRRLWMLEACHSFPLSRGRCAMRCASTKRALRNSRK